MLIILFKFVVYNCSFVDHQSYIVVDHQCDIVVDGNSRELAAMRLCASQTGLGRNGIHRKSINLDKKWKVKVRVESEN